MVQYILKERKKLTIKIKTAGKTWFFNQPMKPSTNSISIQLIYMKHICKTKRLDVLCNDLAKQVSRIKTWWSSAKTLTWLRQTSSRWPGHRSRTPWTSHPPDTITKKNKADKGQVLRWALGAQIGRSDIRTNGSLHA